MGEQPEWRTELEGEKESREILSSRCDVDITTTSTQ